MARENLEGIVKGVNSKKKTKKAWSYLGAIYFGGLLPSKYQEEFAKKINWTSRKLTTWNATAFGMVGTIGEYALAYVLAVKGIPSISSEIAECLGITPEILVHSYYGYNFCQHSFRLVYAQVKKKGIASFNPLGGLIDAIYLPIHYFKKKSEMKSEMEKIKFVL